MKDNPRLGRKANEIVRSPHNRIWVSSASLWEISIKAALRRGKIAEDFSGFAAEDLDETGFVELPITFDHALAVRELPLHHADPFDRMLIAQARQESLTLLTADPRFRPYDVRTIDASA